MFLNDSAPLNLVQMQKKMKKGEKQAHKSVMSNVHQLETQNEKKNNFQWYTIITVIMWIGVEMDDLVNETICNKKNNQKWKHNPKKLSTNQQNNAENLISD